MLREALIREVKASRQSLRSLAIEARIHPTAMGRFTRGVPGYGLSLKAAGRLASVLGLVLVDARTGLPGALDGTPAGGPSPGALHAEAVRPGEVEQEDEEEAPPGLPTDADAPLQDLAPVARKRTNSREFVAKASSPGTRRFLASNGATKQELGPVDAPTDTLALKLARGRWPAHSRFLKVREVGPC